LTHTPLAGERLRPLGHISVGGISELHGAGQALFGPLLCKFAFQIETGMLCTLRYVRL